MKSIFAMLLASLIIGAVIGRYVPGAVRIPAGETAEEQADTGTAENDIGAYRVIVRSVNGDPVEGAVIQFCDDVMCSFRPTDAEGAAVFSTEEQKIYEIHVLKAPEGYIGTDEVYHTLGTWSDVTIRLMTAP